MADGTPKGDDAPFLDQDAIAEHDRKTGTPQGKGNLAQQAHDTGVKKARDAQKDDPKGPKQS